MPYWIGILGGPVTPELQSHLEIPNGRGVMVREVVPNSPAAKAGISQYDILLRANGNEIRDMNDLIDEVRQAGDNDEEVTLELIRRGRQETVAVRPEDRPSDQTAAAPAPGGFQQFPGDPEQLQQFLQQFGQFGPQGPRGFRGPGGFGMQGPGMADLPEGVSITIEKQGDQAARATVQRGDQEWQVSADDPESLEQLPEDLRPMVSSMLSGNQRMQFGMPGGGRMFGPELQQRLERMERQMRQMQRQMRQGDTGEQDSQ